jgi:hypothetical protein
MDTDHLWSAEVRDSPGRRVQGRYDPRVIRPATAA